MVKNLNFGGKCVVCGRNKRIDKNCRLFGFPKNNSARLAQWLQKCKINLSDNKKLFICDLHFENEHFKNRNLEKFATPTLFLNKSFVKKNGKIQLKFTQEKLKHQLPSLKLLQRFAMLIIQTYLPAPGKRTYYSAKTDDMCAKDNNEMIDCDNCERNEKNTVYYKRQNTLLKKRCTVLEIDNKKLKCKLRNHNEKNKLRVKIINKYKNLKQKSISEQIDDLNYVNNNTKQLCKMLLKKRYKNSKYTINERRLAQSIEFRSHSTYQYLRNMLNLQLPAVRTICNWNILNQLQPGFNRNLIEQIENKVEKMSDRDKQHILLFDEINIRSDLKYNRVSDQIIGVVDFGDDERHCKIAKYICVFMSRGLFTTDKFVLSYFATEGPICGTKLKELIVKNVTELQKLGLKIRGVVCDQGTNNRSAYKMLGVHKNQPFFIVDSQKIFALYDIPHLFKSVRNTLLAYDIVTPEGLATWSVVSELYQIDSQSVTRVCPKLTLRHIYPNTFERMRVNLATQILSRSCANGIKTFDHLNKFKTSKTKQHAFATAIFIEKLDKLFDALNSKSQFCSNKANSGLSLKSNNEPYAILKNMCEYLKSIKVQTKNNIFCINGLIHTITGILELTSAMNETNLNISYILTSKLQTDAVENLFSQIRSKGGNNFNPSVYDFNFIVAKIISSKLIFHTSILNYEPDNCSFLETVPFEITNNATQEIGNLRNENENEHIDSQTEYDHNGELEFEDNDFDEIPLFGNFVNEKFEIELPALRYFLGYIIYKLTKGLKCQSCLEYMVKDDEDLSLPSEYLIKCRNYINTSNDLYLRNPADFFLDITTLHVSIFAKYFIKNMHNKRLLQTIFDKCVNATSKDDRYASWFTGKCKEHKENALKFLILVLIRKNCVWQLEKIKNAKKFGTKKKTVTRSNEPSRIEKQNRRLRILNE